MGSHMANLCSNAATCCQTADIPCYFKGCPEIMGCDQTYSLPAYFTSFPSFRPGPRTHWPCLVLTLQLSFLSRKDFFNRATTIKPTGPNQRAGAQAQRIPHDATKTHCSQINTSLVVVFFKWYTTSKYIHDYFFLRSGTQHACSAETA